MYMSEKTKWRFTVPQAGEVDSAESVEARMVDIDRARIGPMNKAELLSNGKKLLPQSFVDGDSSFYSDEPDQYWSSIEGRPIYTTRSHYHPMPTMVLRSNTADTSSYADAAERADRAGYLDPGFTINGKLVTGRNSQSVTIRQSDIPDANRVFWGTSDPSSATISSPRQGDIYVKVI